MATVDKQKFEQVAVSLRAAFMSNNSEGMYDYKEGTEVYSITESINSGIYWKMVTRHLTGVKQ